MSNQPVNGKMTKTERAELGQLIRKRERVLKAAVDEHKAVLMAQFETDLDKHYSFDDDPVWKAAAEKIEAVGAPAREEVRRRCEELGIPRRFAPDVDWRWYHNGGSAKAQAEIANLRRLASRQVDAMGAKAKTQIERMSLEAQTEVVANGLESQAAKLFLEQMPAVETLMPTLEFMEVRKLLGE